VNSAALADCAHCAGFRQSGPGRPARSRRWGHACARCALPLGRPVAAT